MRMIDADALIAELQNTIFEDGEDRANVYRVIQGRPTISAQPDVPDTNVGDTISRQAAIDFIDAGRLCNPNEPRWSDNEVVNFLKSRPSTQRTGRWIFETLDGTPGYRPTVMFCSKCSRVSIADYSYCPNCGCAMKGEEE